MRSNGVIHSAKLRQLTPVKPHQPPLVDGEDSPLRLTATSSPLIQFALSQIRHVVDSGVFFTKHWLIAERSGVAVVRTDMVH